MFKIIKIFSFFLLFFGYQSVFSAEINISKVLPDSNDLKVGDEVLLNIVLDSEDTVYNALEGELLIPDNFDIKNVITGNSFISVWLENPTNFNENSVRFSGITPAGYNNKEGIVFSLVLKVKQEGEEKVSFKNVLVFRNDGLGTYDTPSVNNLSLKTRDIKEGEESYIVSVKDTTPPEEFKVTLVKDLNIFEGKYALIFSTLDKGSGLKSYDVIEGRDVFKQVESPYLLKNQALNEKIYIKAIDFEGNETVSVFKPLNKICIGINCYGYVELSVFILIAFGLVFILWKKKIKLFRK